MNGVSYGIECSINTGRWLFATSVWIFLLCILLVLMDGESMIYGTSRNPMHKLCMALGMNVCNANRSHFLIRELGKAVVR